VVRDGEGGGMECMNWVRVVGRRGRGGLSFFVFVNDIENAVMYCSFK
jgi:hypothetical protein